MKLLVKKISLLISINNASEQRFFLDIFRLFSFSAVAKIITAVSLPFLSRLYEPEAFGILSGYIALLGFISCIGALKIEYTIPLARSIRKARYLLSAALAVSCLMILLMVLFVFTIWPVISPEYSSIKLRLLFICSAIGVLLYIVFRQWLIRFEDYTAIGISQFWQSVWQTLFRAIIPLFAALFALPGLLVGDVIGRFAVASILWRRSATFSFLHYIKSYRIWSKILKPYRKQFLTHTFSSLLNELPLVLLPLTIIYFYHETEAGYVAMAYTAVQSAANVIITPVMQVFFGNITKLFHSQPNLVHGRFIRLISQLLLLMSPAILIVLTCGVWLFSYVFGANWAAAGVYCQILLPALVTQLAIGPTLNLLVLTRSIHRQFIVNLVWTLAVFILVAYNFVYHLEIKVYLACVSFIFTAVYLWLAFEIHKVTKNLGKEELQTQIA